MAQELIFKGKKVAIIGAGPAGCMCAKILKDSGIDFTVFESDEVLKTLLPTGGGKCNLAYAQYDFKELAKNYPRGEKFLYSIFSRFGTNDTVEFFKSIGVKTYVRQDNRIFPISNSAKDVRLKFLKALRKFTIVRERVNKVIYDETFGWKIITDKEYFFDTVVIAIGGHSGISILSELDINIISQSPALTGLITNEDFSQMAGVAIPDVKIKIDNKTYSGDMLFTHRGISGPVIYEVSSYMAREPMPYEMSIKLANAEDLAKHLDLCNKQEIVNALKKYVPKSLAKYILNRLGISESVVCNKIRSEERKAIQTMISDFRVNVKEKMRSGEVVMSGGVDLNETNPKTLESKMYRNLYFCGEILNIDGLCGGFNLQNCWSTGFVVANAIISKFE